MESNDEITHFIKHLLEKRIDKCESQIKGQILNKDKLILQLSNRVKDLKKQLSKAKSEAIEFEKATEERICHFKKIYDERFLALQTENDTFISSLKSKIEESKNHVSDKHFRITIKKLKLKLKKRKSRYVSSVKRSKELSGLVEKQDKILEVKNKKLDELCVILEKNEIKFEEVSAENAALKKRNDEIVETNMRIENMKSQEKEYENRLEELESENLALKKSKDEESEMVEMKIELMKNKLKEHEDNLKDVSSHNKRLVSEISSLKEHFRKYKEDNEQHEQAIVEKTTSEMALLKSVSKSLKDQLASKMNEIERLSNHVQNCKDNHDIVMVSEGTNDLKLKNLQEENLELTTTNKNICKMNEELGNDIRKQVEKNYNSEILVGKLKESLKQKEALIQCLQRNGQNGMTTRITRIPKRSNLSSLPQGVNVDIILDD